MKLINFNDKALFTPQYAQKVKDIYFSSFPETERRPWQSVLALSAEGVVDAYVVEDENDAVGLVTVWHFPLGMERCESAPASASGAGCQVSSSRTRAEWIYIEHLALSDRCRGRGLGSLVVRELINLYRLPVVLEAEPDGSTPEAGARLRFYRRLEFEIHDGYRYVQPPYSEGLPALELWLLTHSLPAGLSLDEVSRCLHTGVYGVDEP